MVAVACGSARKPKDFYCPEHFAEMDRYAAALNAKVSPECMCLQDVSDGHTRQGFADGRVKKTHKQPIHPCLYTLPALATLGA